MLGKAGLPPHVSCVQNDLQGRTAITAAGHHTRQQYVAMTLSATAKGDVVPHTGLPVHRTERRNHLENGEDTPTMTGAYTSQSLSYLRLAKITGNLEQHHAGSRAMVSIHQGDGDPVNDVGVVNR